MVKFFVLFIIEGKVRINDRDKFILTFYSTMVSKVGKGFIVGG